MEDGAVLGSLLGHLKRKSDLPGVLQLYQSLRKSRGEAIARETFKQVFHFTRLNAGFCFPGFPNFKIHLTET